MTLTRMPIDLVWATWLLILLLELATPSDVVLGIFYVVPLLLGASQRTPAQAWRFLLICCASTLLNLVVPLAVHQSTAQMLINRLEVCLALVVTTTLLIQNQTLQARRLAQDVELARSQLRGDMIATLAHDLKTPVLGTIASLALLEGGTAVEAIRASQQRCLRLIDDLLQVFRAEQEGLQLQLQLCDPLTIAQQALRTVEPIARQRQISLLLRQEPAGPMELLADPALLLRLLENLLLNALNHSLRGQRVWLQLSRQGTTSLIDVRDGGRGFAAEELPRLFQRFARSGDASAGVGLGLYLCRLISEAHGGTISASNDPEGGARIVVRLPDAGGQPCISC